MDTLRIGSKRIANGLLERAGGKISVHDNLVRGEVNLSRVSGSIAKLVMTYPGQANNRVFVCVPAKDISAETFRFKRSLTPPEIDLLEDCVELVVGRPLSKPSESLYMRTGQPFSTDFSPQPVPLGTELWVFKAEGTRVTLEYTDNHGVLRLCAVPNRYLTDAYFKLVPKTKRLT